MIAIFLERLRAGEPTRSSATVRHTHFVDVDDVVRAVLLAAERRGGVVIRGTGVETSIADLDAIREQAVGVRYPPVRSATAG